MNKREYEILSNAEILIDYFPNATGNYEQDVANKIVSPSCLPKGLK